MPKTTTVDVWVCVDEGGDYAVGVDQEKAAEAMDNDIGGNLGRRFVKLAVTVPLPEPLEAAVEVPADATPATATAAAA